MEAKLKKAKIVIDPKRCKGCTLCVAACPRKMIEISKELSESGVYPACFIDDGKCTGCTLCAVVCPDVAIEVFNEDKV